MNPAAQPTHRPVWRSLLYVPAHIDRFVAKAHLRGADAIQLDLEDSVPADRKPEARRRVPDAATQISRGGADVVVRVNRPWRLALPDLEAVVCPQVHAIALPKVPSAEHVIAVDEVLSDLEAERDMPVGFTRIIAMIETPQGLLRVEEISTASPRVVALTLGTEDFAMELGVEPEGDVMTFPKQQVVVAARAAGLLTLGLMGTLAGYDDLESFRALARRSRRFGCDGASAIHPVQVPILNEEFAPTQEQVLQARRVIAAYDTAQAEGRGAVEVDGKMVDVPVVERAKQLLARHTAIADRETTRP